MGGRLPASRSPACAFMLCPSTNEYGGDHRTPSIAAAALWNFPLPATRYDKLTGTNTGNPSLIAAMVKPSPGMRRVLRQAHLYGRLVAHNGNLYFPGGTRRLCSEETAIAMVKAGWLRHHGEDYEVTPDGVRADARREEQ